MKKTTFAVMLDSYLKIGAVREAGYRLFSVDEKEPKVDLYIPPKRGDLQ